MTRRPSNLACFLGFPTGVTGQAFDMAGKGAAAEVAAPEFRPFSTAKLKL